MSIDYIQSTVENKKKHVKGFGGKVWKTLTENEKRTYRSYHRPKDIEKVSVGKENK